MKPQVFFRFSEVDRGLAGPRRPVPLALARAIATLLPEQRHRVALLHQEEAAAACAAVEYLHPEELLRYQGFSLPKRRREFLAGRLCAKLALTELLPEQALAPRQLFITSDPSGRPLPPGDEAGLPPGLHLSITHGGEFAGAIAANRPCGIDLQPLGDNLLRVRERYCLPADEVLLSQTLTHLGERERLALLWTAKEAAKKALSHRRMYGFLELSLVTLQPPPDSCFFLGLAVAESGAQPQGAEALAVATLVDDCALALSFATEE